MYGYIYETINLITGKKYIGQKVNSIFLKEKYLGSGIYLKRAVNKYGKENFKVRLIEECNSQEELNNKEIYWINYYNAIESSNYYNIGAGGLGWNNSLNKINRTSIWLGRHHTEESKKKMSESHKGKPWTRAQREALLPTRQGKNNPMYGTHRILSEETKKKISKSNTGKRIWVCTELENKFILKEDLDKYLKLGYSLGRNNLFRQYVSQQTKKALQAEHVLYE